MLVIVGQVWEKYVTVGYFDPRKASSMKTSPRPTILHSAVIWRLLWWAKPEILHHLVSTRTQVLNYNYCGYIGWCKMWCFAEKGGKPNIEAKHVSLTPVTEALRN